MKLPTSESNFLLTIIIVLPYRAGQFSAIVSGTKLSVVTDSRHIIYLYERLKNEGKDDLCNEIRSLWNIPTSDKTRSDNETPPTNPSRSMKRNATDLFSCSRSSFRAGSSTYWFAYNAKNLQRYYGKRFFFIGIPWNRWNWNKFSAS